MPTNFCALPLLGLSFISQPDVGEHLSMHTKGRQVNLGTSPHDAKSIDLRDCEAVEHLRVAGNVLPGYCTSVICPILSLDAVYFSHQQTSLTGANTLWILGKGRQVQGSGAGTIRHLISWCCMVSQNCVRANVHTYEYFASRAVIPQSKATVITVWGCGIIAYCPLPTAAAGAHQLHTAITTVLQKNLS